MNDRLVAGLGEREIGEYLIQLLQSANLKNPASITQDVPDKEIHSNEEFWKGLVGRNASKVTFKWVNLKAFQLTDWFPRTPGMWHTDEAASSRSFARQFETIVDGIKHYKPNGKEDLVQRGGLGSLRFKPITIDGTDCWLYTATSDNYCHTGIPIAIPQNILESIDFDTSFKVNLTGQIRFLPEFLEKFLYHWVDVPQVYLLVDKITKLPISSQKISVTPTILFRFDTRKTDYDSYLHIRHGISFVTCYPENVTSAADWLEWYVDIYGEEILTNFDQQKPFFANAPFSIENVMTAKISVNDLRNLQINNAEVIVEQLHQMNSRSIKARKIDMSKKIEINVNDSGKLDIKGDLIIADTIKDSFNKVQSMKNSELKKLMEDFTVVVSKMAAEMPESQQKEIAQDLEILVTESSKEKPSKRRWEFSLEGLKNVAKDVGEIGKPVIELATKLSLILAAVSG